MGRRGPPPTPSAIKQMRGTSRPCRSNPDEPKIPLVVPPVPHGLDRTERRHWDRWVDELVMLGLIGTLHGPALEQLVRAEVRLLRARKAHVKYGAVEVDTKTGATRRSGYAVELDAAEAAYRRWIAEFGATPAQATRVRASASGESSSTQGADPKARFFGGAS